MSNLVKILIGSLVISLVFNFVLVINTKQEFERKDKEFKATIEKKEQSIQTLENQLDQANKTSIDEDGANSNDVSKTELEMQNQYKDVANQFIHAYLDYSVANKGERRTNLLKVTEKSIVDILAPDAEDLGDPNFKSSVNNASIYVEPAADISEKCNVIVDVKYTIEGSENGKTELRNLMNLTLEKKENGIKVVDFEIYPVK